MQRAKRKIKRVLYAARISQGMAAFCCLVVAACAGDAGPYPDLPVLGISGKFSSKNLCSLGVSPALMLSQLPVGTAIYRVRMTDVSVLMGARWQGEVPARGAAIPEGALAELPLPCPAEKQTLTFRLEVMALTADGRPLAYGWNFLSAQSIENVLSVEREQAKSRQPADVTPVRPSRPPFFTN
jgi:hypothetical protein